MYRSSCAFVFYSLKRKGLEYDDDNDPPALILLFPFLLPNEKPFNQPVKLPSHPWNPDTSTWKGGDIITLPSVGMTRLPCPDCLRAKKKKRKREKMNFIFSPVRGFFLNAHWYNTRKTGLDVGRVEHHTDRGAEGLRREVVAELSADDAGVAYFLSILYVGNVRAASAV